jgi:hypothetical protein
MMGDVRGSWVSALGLAGVLALPLEPAMARPALSGVWSGYYAYEDGAAPVPFEARLESDGPTLQGTTTEPNTFGRSPVKTLKALLSGVIGADGSVRFVKTYDGTGGETHSVDYSGRIEEGGSCISGTWRIGEGAGSFRMCAGAGLVS